jgi:alpha-L-fucosidase
MNRRLFLETATGFALQSRMQRLTSTSREPSPEHRLPESDIEYRRASSYIEETPIPEYHWASESAYDAFRDVKYGIRIHWGIYSIVGQAHESWPYLKNVLRRA